MRESEIIAAYNSMVEKGSHKNKTNLKSVSEEDLKKILAAIQRLIYDKAVLVDKDKEVINLINNIIEDNQND